MALNAVLRLLEAGLGVNKEEGASRLPGGLLQGFHPGPAFRATLQVGPESFRLRPFNLPVQEGLY
jgi:hypothetical protein